MNKFFIYLYSGATYFMREFLGQIIAALILFGALISWFHFSSIYAAIPVIILGLLAWGAVSKALSKKKQNESKKPNNASR